MIKKLISELTFQKEIYLILISVLLFAISLGINIICLPAILTENNISPMGIGIAVIIDILAGILSAIFLSKISSKLGLINTLLISSTIYAISTSLIYFYQNFLLWLTFCAIMGSAFFTFIITRQAWLNSILTDTKRSVGLGLFSLIISIGLATGPIIVNFSGANNHLSFIISSILTLLAFQIIRKIAKLSDIKIEEKSIKFKDFFKNNPRCFLSKYCLEFQIYFLFAFTVIFGKEINLTAEKSGLLITAFTLGGLFDLLAGFLIKKHNPYKLINIGFSGCLTFFIMVTFYYESYSTLVVLYFLFGSFVALNHISSLTIVNNDYKSENLVAANSTFQAIGSIGALSSALIGGILMNIIGKYGFTLTIILGCLIYLTNSVFYKQKN